MRLISFLGTGNYAETVYTFNEQECKTRYIAAALSEFFKVDSIIILATKEAYSTHAKGLSDELERLSLPQADIRTIPSGGATEELWKQFEIIHTAVTDNQPASISFDITHGFRSQPFFAAAVINYLRATLENPPDMQAYYGEWRKDESTSPVWDISTFISLLDWSSALQSFMKTGHGADLAKLAKRENATIQKTIQGERPRKLATLADSIKAFSDNIATVRVPQIITGKHSDRGSAANVLYVIAQSETEVRLHFMPLFPVLEALKAKILPIPAESLFSSQGHQSMLALAKLYVDYERYPEAAIVVREGWISLYGNANQPDEQQLLWEVRKGMEDCWEKAEGTQSTNRIADQIRNVRNDIQHGGFKEKDARNPAMSLIRDLRGLVDKFETKLNLI